MILGQISSGYSENAKIKIISASVLRVRPMKDCWPYRMFCSHGKRHNFEKALVSRKGLQRWCWVGKAFHFPRWMAEL